MSREFKCEQGLRQGCILSPTLFSLFINEITTQMQLKGKHGVQLLPGMKELFIIIFADDVSLVSSTPQGLQNQLNILTDVS